MNKKALIEKKNSLLDEMEQLLEAAATETRALSSDEEKVYKEKKDEVSRLSTTIAEIDEAERRAAEKGEAAERRPTEKDEQAEERAFCGFILGRSHELRAGEQNLSMGNNSAIIPTTIANRIIKAVYDRCPIFAGATRYNVKGNLKIPKWSKANSTHDITVGYATEFNELTADSGAFTSIDLSGYLVGALVLIGRSVENNAAFSTTNFIVTQIADEVSRFIEHECLAGTGSSAAEGALATTNGITAASGSAVTADELIELQAAVKQAYQQNACWTMAPSTFTAIKKLKDGNNRYLLTDDFSGQFPYRLLGKPVYLSDSMPEIGSAATPILYGDYSGLSVNVRENISVEVLREKYATQHAIGVVTWFEFDSKVTDEQKLAKLTMGA